MGHFDCAQSDILTTDIKGLSEKDHEAEIHENMQSELFLKTKHQQLNITGCPENLTHFVLNYYILRL